MAEKKSSEELRHCLEDVNYSRFRVGCAELQV